MQIFSSNST